MDRTRVTVLYWLVRKFRYICIALAAALPCIALPVFTASRRTLTAEALSADNTIAEEAPSQEPDLLYVFRESYPDVAFEAEWDESVADWRVHISVPGAAEGGSREYDVLWADGAMLSQEAAAERGRYWTLLYRYAAQLPDPAAFSEEDIERMRSFGSASNRMSGAGTPMFFFDILYDGFSRAGLEGNIVSVQFLGHTARIHRRIQSALSRVQENILALAQTDTQVRQFVSGIKSTDAYYWRQIGGTNRKSFHSYGIAIDILPKSLGGKAIYWAWTKDKEPDNWMLTPLEDRWMPPQGVIDIFEAEGFIWGGKWAVWDNMHFEYHPELIRFGRLRADEES